MITTLRQSLKSNAYRIFLWTFLIIMVVGGISFDFKDTSKWAIKAYNQKLTEFEWHQALVASQRQLDYIKSLGINWPRTESIEKEVLRSSLSNLLLQHNAHELSLIVPISLVQDQLATTLQHLPAHFFDASGKLNIQMLEKQIAPRSYDEFLHEIENEIKSNLIHSIVALGSSYVPNFETASQYHEEYTNKKYSVVTFSLKNILARVKQENVSDETLERFYKKNEHGDAYKSAEKRSGTCWKFSAQDYGIQILPQDVTAYYDEHKHAEFLETAAQVQVRRIFFTGTTDAKEKALAIHEQLIQDPTSFTAVAKKITADKIAGQGSSLTEFFTKDSTEYDKVLVDTAFEQLSNDLDVSDIIKTDKGYEILQRVARKSAQYRPMSQVKDQIHAKLIESKFAKRFKQDAERLTGHADYNDKNAVASFIEKRKGRKSSIELDVKKTGLIAMHLFQTDKDRYAVFMDDKEGVLLQCTDVTKKALKPFHEVKATVFADYYKKQAQQELQTIAADAIKEAAGHDLQKLAQLHGAEFANAEFTYQDGKAEYSAILNRPEVMQKVKSLLSVGEMIDVVTATESMLIRLDEMAEINENLFVEKKATIEKALSSKAKHKGRDSFIASLYRRAKLNAKIEIKDQLLKDAKETV